MRLLAIVLLSCVLVAAVPRRDEKAGPRALRRNPKPVDLSLPRGGRATADYKLPTDVKPTRYDIWIIPYMETAAPSEQFTFDGTVVTDLSVLVSTNKIVMHARNLNISTVNVKKMTDNSTVGVMTWDIVSDDRNFFTITLQDSLLTGTMYQLTITYRGYINADLDGFYRFSYMDENGDLQYVAATDLEPCGSRKIIPWFDQPDFKANIKVHLAKEPGRTVVNNMPIEMEGIPVEGLPGWVWVDFRETPPMSSYLIAFAVHKYTSLVSQVDSRFSVIARPAIIGESQDFLDLTPDTINYFENFTGHSYMLPKLDHFSLIEFNSGGMENWGLITYLEEYIRFNPAIHTTYDWQWTATLLTHEVAHMWFGDYVSPNWWSNLWLNEGFATYFEVWSIQGFMNDWQLDEQFLTDYTHRAFITDAQANTHPIYATVDSPNSISNIFDRITYSKGGCIVKFMVNYMGESSFKMGIDNYFNIKAYTAADQSELFNVLGLYSPPIPNGLTFAQMMDTWTKQAGFPLVTVTRDYNAHTATIKQERFGSVGSEEWVIPLTMTTSAAPNFNSQAAQAWLLPGGGSITLQDPLVPSTLQWMMLNIRRSGFYRVNYDETNWALIATYLTTPGGVDTIAPENRAQLMNDALALARVGRLNYNTALRTTAYLNLETRLTPWVTATDDLEFVRDRMYQTTEGIQIFQSYMRSKLATVYAAVNGFVQGAGDTHATLLTRWTATRWHCDMNDNSCNSEGVAIFRQWQQEANPDVNNPVIPDLRTPVYCAGQRKGGQADFDFLMARYKNAPVYSDESTRLLNAMGCASDTAILLNLLTASLNPLDVAPGDSIRALRSVSYNPLGADLGLDFIIANWVQLDSLYGNIGNGFLTLADVLNTQEHYTKIVQFRSDNLSQLSLGALTGIQSTLNILEENMDWNFAYLNVVMEYFRFA